MLENQFIQFQDTSLVVAKLRESLPVVITSEYHLMLATAMDKIMAVDSDDTEILTEAGDEDVAFQLFGQEGFLETLPTLVAIGDVFFLKVRDYGTDTWRYSQPLVRVPADDFSGILYKCAEDALGFPFKTYGAYAGADLPIHFKNPQNVQEDKTYVKANGDVVTLYAKYYKEWEGETEYLSEAMHDKIVAALSCDEVIISGRSGINNGAATHVTKTDNYQVDWENYTMACDGKTKLARATFKVRENKTQRNSNY